MKFKTVLQKLLQDPSRASISVHGKKKTIKGMARFTSCNYHPSEYIKVAFEDGSFLLLTQPENEFYYSETYVIDIPEITDEMIGRDEVITFQGKKYKLENKDDYQYVLQLYVGTIDTIEGEVKFFDYLPISGEKEFLSLGWIVRTGRRADLNPKLLKEEYISIA